MTEIRWEEPPLPSRRIAMSTDDQLPPALREKYRRIADELTHDLDSCRPDLLHQEAAE